MKKLTLISFIFFLTFSLFAQETTTTGPKAGECQLNFKITDWDDIPEADAKVIITNTDGTFKTEGISDIDGEYKIIVPNGVTYDVDLYKFDTVFHFPGVATQAEPDLAYEFDIQLKIKVVSEEYVSISNLNIHFATGKHTINEEGLPALDEWFQQLKDNPKLTIEIAAHTDNVGDDLSNMRLSQRRANSAKEYLESKGIEKNRIVSKGYGEAKPKASNDTTEGKAENRRVEIRVISE